MLITDEIKRRFDSESLFLDKNLIIKHNKDLYKLYINKDFIFEKKRNIKYMIKHPIKNTPRHYEEIIDYTREVLGFRMQYIEKAITFRKATEEEIPIDKKINAIKDVYKVLKKLHELDIHIGDVHSDNLLITEDGKGYIIDLDELRFPGDEWKFKQKYLIKPTDRSFRINKPSNYTDNMKIMISSLSLLLDYDLENLIEGRGHSISLETIANYVATFNDKGIAKALKEKLPNFLEKAHPEYFSDALENFNTSEITKIKKKVLHK